MPLRYISLQQRREIHKEQESVQIDAITSLFELCDHSLYVFPLSVMKMYVRGVVSLVRIVVTRTAYPLCIRYKATSASTPSPAATVAPTVEGADVKPFSAIPGPKGLPVVGTLFHTMKFAKRLHEKIKERHEIYGPIYREKMGKFDIVFLTDVEGIEQLLRQEGKYPSRMQIEHWQEGIKSRNAGSGLFMSEGEKWHTLRRVVDKYMMKVKTVESYAGKLNTTVTEFLERMSRIRGIDGEVPHLDQELFNWSLESLSLLLYEKRLGCMSDDKDKEIEDYINCIHTVFETTGKIMFFSPKVAKILMPGTVKRFYEAGDVGHKFTTETTNERIQRIKDSPGEQTNAGFLTSFLKEDNLSLKDIYSNTTELLGGAVDTTPNTALMVLYEVSRNPDVQKAIYDEVTRVVPRNEQPVAEHLREMHYMKAVIKETLRLYPISSFINRRLQEDTVLMGYHVPKGTPVWIDLYGLGRLKRHYDDPDVFRPERWLRDAGTTRPHPFTWLPFGFGIRMCVGRRVAEMEVQLLISQLVRQFIIEPVTMDPVKMKTDMLLLPKDPVRIRLHDRK